MSENVRHITIPGQRLRKLAAYLFQHDPVQRHDTVQTWTEGSGVRVVCIADTHNKWPEIPDGDLLIHAGDLTENGGFDEMQVGLDWLSAQPHQYKIYVAGNHDVLLDEEFLKRHPERRYGDPRTAANLDWGSVIYLQDRSVTLKFSLRSTNNSHKVQSTCTENIATQLTVYGTPWTPQYLASAFQYPRGEDFWNDRLPTNIDVLVSHGPPRLYLDLAGAQHAGCPFLTKEIGRVRPRPVVFGHIHAGYGVREACLNATRRCYDEICNNLGNMQTLLRMAGAVLYNMVTGFFVCHPRGEKLTKFVNAATVAGLDRELKNSPIEVLLRVQGGKQKVS